LELGFPTDLISALLCGCSVRKNRKKRYEEVAERMKNYDSAVASTTEMRPDKERAC